jgi:hypothetical protein
VAIGTIIASSVVAAQTTTFGDVPFSDKSLSDGEE